MRKRSATAEPSSVWSAIWSQWLSYGVAAVGFLVLYIEAARLLGLAELGYFITAVSTYFVVGQVVLFGTHRIGLRDIAINRDEHPERVSELFAQARAVGRFLVPAATLVVFLVVFGALTLLSIERSFYGALVGAAAVFLVAQQRLWSSFLRGLGAQRTASIFDGASGGPAALVTQTMLLVGYGATASSGSLLDALALMAAGHVPSVLILYRAVHIRVRPGHRIGVSGLAVVLSRSWRFSVIQAAMYATASAELWAAAPFVSSLDLSLLGAAQRLAFAAATPLTAMQIVASPVIARTVSRADATASSTVMRGAGGAAIYSTLPFLAPLLLAPGWVLTTVFGSGFEAGTVLLVVMALGPASNLIVGMCGPLLTMTGHESVTTIVMSVALALRFAVEIPLAYAVGVEAVVVAGTAISATTWLTLFIISRRLTGISARPTLRPDVIWALRSVRG